MTGFKDNTHKLEMSEHERRELARKGLERMDRFVQAALTGVLANPAWNGQEAQNYLRAKKLTLEQIAVAAGMEVVIQMDKFLKGEVGGDPDAPDAQLKLIQE